jgi:hypothetical protein
MEVRSQVRNLEVHLEDERYVEWVEVAERELRKLLRLIKRIKIVICVTRPSHVRPYQKLVVTALINVMVPTLNELAKKEHTVRVQSGAKNHHSYHFTVEEDFTVAEWERNMPSLER